MIVKFALPENISNKLQACKRFELQIFVNTNIRKPIFSNFW
jgi:hypothetical protein